MTKDSLKNYLEQVWVVLSKNRPQKVLRTNDPVEVKKELKPDLPESSTSFEEVLGDFEHQIQPFLNLNESPQFGAYITGSGNKISAFAEFIKAWYNQNGLKWNNSPIASELEQLVIGWISELVKLPEYNQGFLTSGGSASNLMALHLALAEKCPEREMSGLGAKRFTIYCSDQTHSSVDRAMVFLGLGRNQLRKIRVNDQFQIKLDELENQITKDLEAGYTPLAIIGNAGTTNTGSIDDLAGLADIAKRQQAWFHVDGAYGLPAIRLPELKDHFNGIEQADSVIINPHKWMYVTFEASCVLTKRIPESIHLTPDYLFTENPGERWESSTHTIELSKEFRALKIWFTMKYFGANQLTDFVRKDIAQIAQLAGLLAQNEHFKIEQEHPLSILCFRYDNTSIPDQRNEQLNIEALRKIERDGIIFITGTKLRGMTYLRVYFGNPERTDQDVRKMADVIADTFKQLVLNE